MRGKVPAGGTSSLLTLKDQLASCRISSARPVSSWNDAAKVAQYSSGSAPLVASANSARLPNRALTSIASCPPATQARKFNFSGSPPAKALWKSAVTALVGPESVAVGVGVSEGVGAAEEVAA
jgi:hypothetical protein